jgi:ribulose-5-phosphate 4-epimerase/fuculose-1-phosphate aldolase
MLLRNHGTLCVGPSIPQAFLTAYFLERACATQVATLAGNRPIHMPAENVVDLVSRQATAILPQTAQLAWAPLIRKLDRIDPGFRR